MFICLFVCLFSVALRPNASSFLWFLDHTQRRITVGWTPLDEWSARRRDLYLTTHNTHNRQTSMPPHPAGFEHTISASERPQTFVLDRAATGAGWGRSRRLHQYNNNNNNNNNLLQLGCHPVAVVILHVNKTWNWLLINLSREGYMGSMQWQLGMLGTVSAFAYRHRETEKTLCRGGRSQDLPNTDF